MQKVELRWSSATLGCLAGAGQVLDSFPRVPVYAVSGSPVVSHPAARDYSPCVPQAWQRRRQASIGSKRFIAVA